jgi:hypothetical protein
MANIEYKTDQQLEPGTTKFIARLRRDLESRYVPLVIAGIAAVMMLPALNAGLIQDDLFHRTRLVKPAQLPGELSGTGLIDPNAGSLSTALSDMYCLTRTQRTTDKLKEAGLCPWWTPQGLRIANWRPLDSFTHWLDYRLFPNSPRLMHLHNIIWFTAVIFLVSILYRRFMAPIWMATLAALLYTFDDSNYFPAMWIANRNLLLALFFSILTLLLHDKWRRHHSLAAGIAAPFTLLLSLLSTEAGIATSAYLFAYALIIDRENRIRRVFSLVPAFVVIATWRVVYSALGYGAAESGFLIDPGREPMRYARAVLERAPVLLSGQWGGTPAEIINFFSDYAGAWYLFASVLYLALILLVLLPLLRKNRVALYWFTGMMLCTLPICATSPMNRNLLFVAIGAFGVMTQFIGGLFAQENWTFRTRFWRVPAWILCVTLIFVHAGFAVVSRARTPKTVSFIFNTFYSTIKVDPAGDLKDKTLVVVNAPNPFLFVALPVLRGYRGQSLPARTRLLVPGYNPLKITRTGEKTLLIESRAGSLLAIDPSGKDFKPNFVYFYHELSSLFRQKDLPFKVGQKIDLSDMSAEVIKVDMNGQPTTVRFEFDVLLEDSSLRWLQWHWKKSGFGYYSTFEIPPVGEKLNLGSPFSEH